VASYFLGSILSVLVLCCRGKRKPPDPVITLSGPINHKEAVADPWESINQLVLSERRFWPSFLCFCAFRYDSYGCGLFFGSENSAES